MITPEQFGIWLIIMALILAPLCTYIGHYYGVRAGRRSVYRLLYQLGETCQPIELDQDNTRDAISSYWAHAIEPTQPDQVKEWQTLFDMVKNGDSK